jgi:hypothetical protein
MGDEVPGWTGSADGTAASGRALALTGSGATAVSSTSAGQLPALDMPVPHLRRASPLWGSITRTTAVQVRGCLTAAGRRCAHSPCRRSICRATPSPSNFISAAPVLRPRGRHPPHKCPHRRTLIGTTGRWLGSTVRSNRSEPMTRGNATAADCSRCRGRRTATLISAAGPADEWSQRPFPEAASPQVKGGLSGQGRGRTADLPLFRRLIARTFHPAPDCQAGAGHRGADGRAACRDGRPGR